MILKSIFLSLIFSINTPQKKDFISKKHFLDNNIFSVLILSETQGYVHHTAIKEGVKLITKLGKKNNFNVTHINNSKYLSNDILNNSDVLIFLCTTLDILNFEEQERMKGFIRKGKGFVGIHSAADTEYNWEWYGKLVGAYFLDHPEIQEATIETIDKNHIATKHLEEKWKIKDEWYNFKSVNPKIKVLLNLDEKSYSGGKNGKNHPITWFHEFDGGRSFYTGLGHRKEIYHDIRFIQLILGGIFYASGN